MANIERTLAEECDKRGLPHDLAVLLRHIENNHAATLGFKDLSIETLDRKLAGAVEAFKEIVAIFESPEDDLSASAQLMYCEARMALDRLGGAVGQ